jgi:hypothetical protein
MNLRLRFYLPWRPIFFARKTKMPRACPVECHDHCYPLVSKQKLDATALCRGDSRSKLNSSEREKLHGASPWHLEILMGTLCSSKREVPRGKPVAS